jgi:hypothetical protein
MDTLSHGLWAAAAASGANRITHRKLRVRWMAFWGVMPDLFSFAPAVAWVIVLMVAQGVPFTEVPRPELMPPQVRDSFFVFRLTSILYHLSHSIITFGVVFLLVHGVRLLFEYYREPFTSKTPAYQKVTLYWEMTGWLLHILFDIPTHSKEFYPTPFLWPLVDVKVDGFSWAKPWFLIFNYSTLLVVFILVRLPYKKRKRQSRLIEAQQERRGQKE